MTTPEPLVDVRGLAKSYGGRRVIGDVTFRLARGDVIGLVGANGGGKTTTLRMIAGLSRPDSGSGVVLGADVRRPRPERRRRIGYMGQGLALYPDLTVAENLRFHADAHGLADPAAGIAATVSRHGLAGVMDRRVGQLSGGWARRAQFAASVLHEPPLLLLDEPTSGLDVATRRTIWGWIADFAKAGHGVLVSTHDLVEAQFCPAIILYADGRAHDLATPAALMSARNVGTLEAVVLASVRGQPS